MQRIHLNSVFLIAILLALAPALPLRAAETSNSIVDQVATSSEVRSNLIAQYERTPADFKDDRLLAAAVSYAYNEQYERAKSAYVAFLKVHPDHIPALRYLGSVCVVREEFAEAIKYLRKAWEMGDQDSLGNLATAYYRARRFEQVELLLPDLLRKKTNNEVIVNCLFAHGLQPNVPNEKLLIEALDGLPDEALAAHGDTISLMATAAERLHSLDERNKGFQSICQKAIRGYLADTNAWPRAYLPTIGDMYFLLGECSKAESVYTQILRGEPNHAKALFGMGSACLCQHRPSQAATYLEKALDLGCTNALGNLAASYYAGGNLDKLQVLIPRLLELKNESIQVLNLVIMYSLAKQPKDRALFYQAIDGLSDGRILRREDTTNAVIMGLKAFGDTERIKRILQKKRDLDKGLKG